MKQSSEVATATEQMIRQGGIAPENTGYHPKPTHVPELNEHARHLVNGLFKSLKAAYPAWRNAIRTDAELEAAKITWIRAFAESGICSEEQLRRGMAKARKHESDFFPSVGKFINWCLPDPEELGLPSMEAAWNEVNDHCHEVLAWRWSCQEVRDAGNQTGWSDLRGQYGEREAEKVRARFERVYTEIVQEARKGGRQPVDGALTDFNRESAEVKQERHSQLQAQKQVEDAGLPHSMTHKQGMGIIKGLLNQTLQELKPRRRPWVSDVTPSDRQAALADVAQREQERVKKLMGGAE